MAEDNQDQWSSEKERILNPVKLFAILMAAGVLAIGFGTFYTSLVLNLVVPIGIMGYYSYTIYNDEEETLSIEQKADSVYYMGFIFTLVAMTASLVALANTNNLDFKALKVE